MVIKEAKHYQVHTMNTSLLLLQHVIVFDVTSCLMSWSMNKEVLQRFGDSKFTIELTRNPMSHGRSDI